MRCKECGYRGEPVGRVFNCPECGYSMPLPDLFQPVAMTGRTTLTKAGDVRVIDGTARTAEVQP